MPVPFKELSGSPAEQYTRDGFTAQREFLIAWRDRDAFAAEVLGRAAEHGASTAASYPGKTSVFAFRLRYAPWDPESVDRQTLSELTEGLNAYGSFAKATVEYQTASPQDREDGPDAEAGTHLTYRMRPAMESEVVLPQGWHWADNPAVPLPEHYNLTRVVPITEHLLTWHQVVNPPWQAIRQTQGTVNTGTFLGCPAGTLLFAGAEAYRHFRSGFDASDMEFCWQIQYLFRERAINRGGRVYGWNHFYRGDPPGWAELVSGDQPMYEAADFSVLFRSATG